MIDQAAAFEGQSMSSFIVAAAAEKAEQVIAAQTTTAVPSEYFDRLPPRSIRQNRRLG